ncbi:MAG TPA: PHB depolymerase family esterase [Terriglobales bacterium]|nr:PHB depolymerase family esterase [Terriglobales bacterium]
MAHGSAPPGGAAVAGRLLRLLAALALAMVALLVTLLTVLDGPTAWRQLNGRVALNTLRQGALTRSYRVYRPAALPSRPGLVVVLHGADGSGQQVERQSGFDAQADRLGWIAVYPDGVEDGWEPFGCCHHAGADDVAFIAQVVDGLERSDGVDPGRVYVTGISRGGMMAYRLACELSSRVAAIAPIEGNMADSAGSAGAVPCRPDRPVSVLAIHGSDDLEIPIDGGRSKLNLEEVSYAPLTDVIADWRRLDACGTGDSVTDSGPSTTTEWRCEDASVVETLVIHGGGHTWPGAPLANLPWSPGGMVDASGVVADFFAAHPRGAPA